MTPIRACLFDKDGTLFDFHATWSAAIGDTLRALAEGNAARLQAMAEAIDYDLSARRVRPGSIAVAGTNVDVAACLAPHLDGWAIADIVTFFMDRVDLAPLAEAVPLGPFLDDLASRGLALGVMTNDNEQVARSQLSSAGVLDRFDFICGADSGYGAKPSPEPLVAFADVVGVPPHQVVMVGDSRHDLQAGAAAGMYSVGVLTGLAGREELAPHAHAILPDFGHLGEWISKMEGPVTGH